MFLGAIDGRLGLGLALLVLVPFRAFADERSACPTNNLQDHNQGLYHFLTTSWVEPLEEGNLHFRIVACIENKQNYAMAYWWPITGLGGRLPQKRAVDVGEQTQTSVVMPIDSCLLYGGAGDTVRAKILIETASGTQAGQDADVDCSKKLAQLARMDQMPVQNVHEKVVNYWPSYSSDPDASLLEFKADIGIAASDGSYTSYVNYEMFPFEGSKGDPSKITFTPAFSGAANPLCLRSRRRTPRSSKAIGRGGSRSRSVI